jgi:histone H3/H4
MIIVKAKLKELAGDFSVASDFAEKLDEKVTLMIKEACERAQANNRKTVMARDL